MTRRFAAILLALSLAAPAATFAMTIAPASFYRDVRANTPETAGINLLTREGIVSGFAPQMFGMSRTVNRAEFLKIAMLAVGMGSDDTASRCFPDVQLQWFAPYVCAAAARGIVRGYPDGRFHPEDTVTYGEALKMLVLLFEYDIPTIGGHWAERYYRAAAARRTDIPMTIDLDRPLTRGQAARLAAAFLAESKGQLDALRLAESGEYASSSVSSSMSSSRSSSSSSMPSSSSSVGSVRPMDPIADTTIRSQFLLLGETGPVIGAAKIFIEEEPIDLTAVSINITAQVQGVQSLLVYDDDQRYLGRATLNTAATTNRNYRLTISPGTFEVGKREERTIYFRPQISPFQSGGEAGHVVQIANVAVEGNGVWSSRNYTKQTSGSDTFVQFVTSRSTITSVKNEGQTEGPLVTSTNQLLGTYTFTGRRSDQSAHIDLTSLNFTVEQTGDISLQNVRLVSVGVPEGYSCTVTSAVVGCSGIPDLYGSLTDAPRTLKLYGDVIASGALHASLRLTLNEAGDPQNAGAISWSDGSTTYSWVAIDSPVVSGTNWKY